MELQETVIVFAGHSHVPINFLETAGIKGPTRFTKEETIKIQDGYKYFINVGSVGQPRDGNPKSSYAIYDKENRVVEIKRVEYDIKKTQEKIFYAGLPRILGERLNLGE
jgi:diadenosine tetraphosphatase ApaH/serine/threonine PP2A family protein phosphatase